MWLTVVGVTRKCERGIVAFYIALYNYNYCSKIIICWFSTYKILQSWPGPFSKNLGLTGTRLCVPFCRYFYSRFHQHTSYNLTGCVIYSTHGRFCFHHGQNRKSHALPPPSAIKVTSSCALAVTYFLVSYPGSWWAGRRACSRMCVIISTV